MWPRSLIVWCVLLVVAVANGGLREAVFVPRLGPGLAHQVSSLVGSAAIILVTVLALPWIAPPDTRAAWQIGLLWILLVAAFEFLAGHYLFGHPWERLLADYNLLRGRLWILVLVSTLVAPRVAFWWYHSR